MLEEQDARLSKELERRKQHELRDEKIRQRIREDSEEYRSLKAKLETAYLVKDRASQLEEGRMLSEQRKVMTS